MTNVTKVMIVAPFWRQVGHVGVYRVDRFVRWLSAEGVQIVLVRAGSKDNVVTTDWGVEISVRDPLALYRDTEPSAAQTISHRKPNRLRRLAAHLVFNPDPTVAWARRAAKHSDVLRHGGGAEWVLSSSPPESAHVAAAALAKQLNSSLVVDMRDGWLDEPLKPLLQQFRVQRWREGRLEKAILRQAKCIFVTSTVWKQLLEKRLPFSQGKTVVLTNGYPSSELFDSQVARRKGVDKPLRLLHAGRFTGSSGARKISQLIKPLLHGLEGAGSKGTITLIGKLEPEDLDEGEYWRPRLEEVGWSLEVMDPIPRDQMIRLLSNADGLLLLSSSHAAIPSKIFEYLPIRKPIFTATPKTSAVWEVCRSLPQVFLVDYDRPQDSAAINFVNACRANDKVFDIPTHFREDYLSRIFLKEFGVA